MFRLCFLLVSVLSLQLPLQSQDRNEGPSENTETLVAIDRYIENLRGEHGFPGVALAIRKGDKLVHSVNYGYANLEHEVPICERTGFRLFSLTKPIVSVAVFQLIESGKIGLEQPLSAHIGDLPKDWRDVEIGQLLAHSSGLPDIATPYLEVRDLTLAEAKQRVFAMPIKFSPGERFDYNQTNYWLLEQIIAKHGDSFDTYVLTRQFSTAGNEAYFSTDSRDIIPQRASLYFPFNSGRIAIDTPYSTGDFGRAASGLHLTLRAFIAWDKRFTKGELLKVETKSKMLSKYMFSNQSDVFAYGWGLYRDSGEDSYGFTGAGCTAYRVYPEEDLSILFLSNGFDHSKNMNDVIRELRTLLN